MYDWQDRKNWSVTSHMQFGVRAVDSAIHWGYLKLQQLNTT